MTTASNVTVIPATLTMQEGLNENLRARSLLRVAAYARVSTDSDEKINSYEAQLDYYTKFIRANSEWEFIEVYTDPGLSGTRLKKRDGFNRMISDTLCGKIDMIIIKSVSRFARNTVDSISTVRKLRARGVDIYFETENIHTMDGNSEFIVSIMSSVAQKESEDINQNVTWGHRKRFADGKILMSYKSFLGYEKGQDGEPKIVEEEAAIVRQIYALFLEGKTYHQIAKTLMSNEILTPKKQKNWSVTTVQSILKNEKYAGNALLQKNFTVDFLSKTIKKNEGEVPQYFVENSHPAIIPQETFDLTQSEIARRAKMGGKFGGCGRLFSGKIICGRCGAFYGSKVWRDHKGNEKTVWQCKNRNKNGKCNAPYLSKDQIKQAYVRAYNEILGDKNRYLQELEDICTELSNLQKLDIEIFNSRQELEIVAELIRKAIEENARIALDQGDYRQHYSALRKRFEIKKTRQDELLAQRAERIAKRAKTHKFLEDLRNQDNRIADFDEHSWNVLVETAVYHDEEKFTVKFRDGRETRVC